MPTTATTMQSLAERAQNVLMPNYGQRSIAIVRGQGSRCWDADGKEYLDFLSGIAVNNLGHNHPAVVEAIHKQVDALCHCSNAFLIEPQIELAERLTAATGLAKAFFGNSGTEMTEAALKLARRWSLETKGAGNDTVIAFENSFHGRTYGSMSATWSKKVRTGFGPLLPGFAFAKFNDLDSVDEVWTDQVCAVLVETVQGEGGVNPATEEFLKGLRERCTARGALLIVDEIQCGMSRTGRPMAYQHYGIEPDLVPVAKAVGGGLPLGALLARAEYADVLDLGSHGSTFGGNPVACAAGKAVCDILFQDDFLRSVGEKACKFWGKLEELKAEFPDLVESVRGKGLMLGLVLKVPGADAIPITRKNGLLFNCTAERVLRFVPPLTISDADIEEAAEKLRVSLKEFAAK